jgi:hypothetical protein
MTLDGELSTGELVDLSVLFCGSGHSLQLANANAVNWHVLKYQCPCLKRFTSIEEH